MLGATHPGNIKNDGQCDRRHHGKVDHPESGGPDCGRQWVLKPERDQPQRPQQRRQKGLQDRAQELHLKTDEATGPELLPQQVRVAHVGDPSHHIALDPARALLDPRERAAVGFFKRRGVDQFGAVAVAEQAQAQIGVFGHILRVPAAEVF